MGRREGDLVEVGEDGTAVVVSSSSSRGEVVDAIALAKGDE